MAFIDSNTVLSEIFFDIICSEVLDGNEGTLTDYIIINIA